MTASVPSGTNPRSTTTTSPSGADGVGFVTNGTSTWKPALPPTGRLRSRTVASVS
ncbi:Uncharacterised protein [Mycobacteroides abscessus]|nr:Uncharacterised protein [Mycobacteroides abscessus]